LKDVACKLTNLAALSADKENPADIIDAVSIHLPASNEPNSSIKLEVTFNTVSIETPNFFKSKLVDNAVFSNSAICLLPIPILFINDWAASSQSLKYFQAL